MNIRLDARLVEVFTLMMMMMMVIIMDFHGSYAAAQIRSSCPSLRLPNGRVRIRSGGRTAKFNCFRGYQLLGDRYATCIRGQWDTELPICVRTGCSPISYLPHGMVLESYRGAVLRFICNPGYTLSGSKIIYCNGTMWNATVPVCRTTEAAPQTFCDFESDDLCGWNQDPNHHIDWRRHSYSTPSGHVGTGPSYDHTLGEGKGGYYMYIETSSPRMENDSARLFSPVYSSQYSKDACFFLWYHMFGATTGYLQIYIKPEGVNLSAIKPSWSKFGDQGNEWYEGYVPISLMETPFQIVVEALRGPGYVSDTAIDDLKLTSGPECVMPTTLASTTYLTSDSSESDMEHLDNELSCRTRCRDNSTAVTLPKLSTLAEVPVLLSCDCHLGCLEEKTCCPDYSHYCIQALGTLPFIRTTLQDITTDVSSISPPTKPPPLPMFPTPPPLPPLPPHPGLMTSVDFNFTALPKLSTLTTAKQNIVTDYFTQEEKASTIKQDSNTPPKITTNIARTTTLKPTFKPSPFPTKIPTIIKTNAPRSTIKTTVFTTLPPTKPTTVIRTTMRRTTSPTTTKPTTVTTRKTTVTTRKTTVTTRKTTKKPQEEIKYDEEVDMTDFVTEDSDWYSETDADYHVARLSNTKSGPIFPTAGIIGIAAVVVVVLVVTMSIACAVLRRRRKFQRQHNIAEDSDIRFLTADEQLNFEIAQPKYDDGL